MKIHTDCKCEFRTLRMAQNIPGHVEVEVVKRGPRCHHQEGDRGLFKQVKSA